MKIVDRKAFLALPAGTLFAKYKPHVFDDLCIKGDSLTNDFFYQDIVGAIDAHDSDEWGDKLEESREAGCSVATDFECQARDGCFDANQLFMVFEPQDVRDLIGRLDRALADSEGNAPDEVGG